MILEGVVTTLNPQGVLNVAPMGPKVEGTLDRFVLRPFKTSTTFGNLKANGEGVLHVTDDVLLLARTAIGLRVDPETRPAEVVRGRILSDACRYYEFRVVELDDHQDRSTILVETVAQGRHRDFFGLNRAKHAVVEAAILATRVDFLPVEEILSDYRKLALLVEKTGGEAEEQAFALLRDFVLERAHRRGHDGGDAAP
ncbi:DUF447 domain-containing protein [Singulisphaera rosea]